MKEVPLIHRHDRLVAFVATLGVVVLCAGCGRSGSKSIVPVSGQVLFDGKPLPGAQVTFIPVQEDGEPGVRPTATADSVGRFRLSTFKKGDGAPQGQYRVVVEHRRWIVQNGEDKVTDNWLPKRYSDSKKSELRVEVAGEPKDVSLALKR